MLQIIFMVLGIVYLFKLIGLGKASTKLGLSPEVLAEWRDQRSRQYLWGIVAGWGSLVVYFLVAKATIDPDGYYTQSDALAAQAPSWLVELAVLIVGVVLSIRAGRKAKATESHAGLAKTTTP